MTATLRHESLGATLRGVEAGSGKIWQFRGLQYGVVPARFAKASPAPNPSSDVSCTAFGPRCPQNYVDFRHLLRVPEELAAQEADEDEFGCLNLDVTLPVPFTRGLIPVLFWIHGGSQTVTFGSAASKLCDPTKLIMNSIREGQPIIVVNLNYRLNMFAFGDGEGEKNLALKDQILALDYVRRHIRGFGGDPERITIAGESAGAVFAHAHMVIGSPARQCVLQSGSLYLSPPQPLASAQAVLQKVKDALAELGDWSLANAPVKALLQAQSAVGLVSVFLHQEEALADWETKHGVVERLLIGDTEYESAIFTNGIEQMSADSINNLFDNDPATRSELKTAYGIIPSRARSCKLGALDFLHDLRFTVPIEKIVKQWKGAQRPVFRYLVDQTNPWQTSSRAHHAVDLLFLFEGFDLSLDAGAQKVGAEMMKTWATFVNDGEPWPSQEYYAFGPLGESRSVDQAAYAGRRRAKHCKLLEDGDHDKLDSLWRGLAAGRISLQN